MPFFEVERHHDLFMQQSRKWVFFGAGMLAMTAGYINVVMLSFFAVPVSHMSGAVSELGIELGAGVQTLGGLSLANIWLITSIIVGFFAGAFVSGLVLRDTLFKMRRRYGVLLLIESALLAVSLLLALRGYHAAVPVAAMACG